MPLPYTLDLRWRAIWMSIAHGATPTEIGQLLCLSERTVRRYLALFQQTGVVEPAVRTNGPQRLLGGMYHYKLQDKLHQALGVIVSLSTIVGQWCLWVVPDRSSITLPSKAPMP